MQQDHGKKLSFYWSGSLMSLSKVLFFIPHQFIFHFIVFYWKVIKVETFICVHQIILEKSN